MLRRSSSLSYRMADDLSVNHIRANEQAYKNEVHKSHYLQGYPQLQEERKGTF